MLPFGFRHYGAGDSVQCGFAFGARFQSGFGHAPRFSVRGNHDRGFTVYCNEHVGAERHVIEFHGWLIGEIDTGEALSIDGYCNDRAGAPAASVRCRRAPTRWWRLHTVNPRLPDQTRTRGLPSGAASHTARFGCAQVLRCRDTAPGGRGCAPAPKLTPSTGGTPFRCRDRRRAARQYPACNSAG